MCLFVSVVRDCGGCATLVTAEVREGSWGAAPRGAGLLVEWPGDNTCLKQGDRFVYMEDKVELNSNVFRSGF